jgi:hypothetical protein
MTRNTEMVPGGRTLVAIEDLRLAVRTQAETLARGSDARQCMTRAVLALGDAYKAYDAALDALGAEEGDALPD